MSAKDVEVFAGEMVAAVVRADRPDDMTDMVKVSRRGGQVWRRSGGGWIEDDALRGRIQRREVRLRAIRDRGRIKSEVLRFDLASDMVRHASAITAISTNQATYDSAMARIKRAESQVRQNYSVEDVTAMIARDIENSRGKRHSGGGPLLASGAPRVAVSSKREVERLRARRSERRRVIVASAARSDFLTGAYREGVRFSRGLG